MTVRYITEEGLEAEGAGRLPLSAAQQQRTEREGGSTPLSSGLVGLKLSEQQQDIS